MLFAYCRCKVFVFGFGDCGGFVRLIVLFLLEFVCMVFCFWLV